MLNPLNVSIFSFLQQNGHAKSVEQAYVLCNGDNQPVAVVIPVGDPAQVQMLLEGLTMEHKTNQSS